MYIVSMQNGANAVPVEIQNEHHKLFSGSVVKGINTIDSFTFSILPNNPAFGELRDFNTLVSVYNLARRRYEFYGRVLYTSPQMSDKGLLTQEAICESYLGFLCDSQQEYVAEQNWTVRGLLEHILTCHNAQLESYKHFRLGQVWEDADPNDNLFVGIQRENTWETIKKKLIDTLGGEIRFRVVDGVNYLDYVEAIGETKETEIALSKNMKSIVKEKNPSAFITRLIPLGAKLGNDSEERLGIAEVNGGSHCIEDAEAIAEYGVHVGYVEFDDVTEPDILLTKARKWLEDNNKVSVKYSITALDLSLIGLDVDDFDVGNTHPLKNSLLGIDDSGRINKKTIDVCDETKTSFEIGESFKTLSELQREQMVSVGKLNSDVAEIIRNYATNERLNSEITRTMTYIEEVEGKIKLGVTEEHLTEVLSGYATQDLLWERPTHDELNGVLGDYTTIDRLNETASDIQNTISDDLNQNYVSNDALNEKLDDYATKTLLTEYVTSADLEITKSGIFQEVSEKYTTKDSLGTTLESYATTANLSTMADSIMGQVSATYATQDSVKTVEGKLELKIDESALISKINAVANEITITSDKFQLTADGSITARNANLSGIFRSESPLGNTVVIENGYVSCRTEDAYSGDEYIMLKGQSITLKNAAPTGDTPTLEISRVGSAAVDGAVCGWYAIESDGRLELIGVKDVCISTGSGSTFVRRQLVFNNNGSVTWTDVT